MKTNAHNLDAHLLGTGEFSFAEGATVATAGRSVPFLDLGNMLTYSVQPDNTTAEHKGSYRGLKRVDKRRVSEAKLMYQFKLDEWHLQNLLFIYYGSRAGDLTQLIQTNVSADSFDFTTVNAKLGHWYDITVSGTRIRKVSALFFGSQTTTTAAGANAGDVFTDAAHGLLDGTRIILTNLGTVTGPSTFTVYFIVNKTADTFQIAATAGGTPIVLGADGTVTYQTILTADVDYELDDVIGRARFLTAQTGHVYPIVTAPAIDSTSADCLRLITPLTTTKREGIGRLLLFDDDSANQVATQHDLFGCELTLNGNAEGDGEKFTEFTLDCLVTTPVGTVGARELAAGTV